MARADAVLNFTAVDKTKAAFDRARRNLKGLTSSLLNVKSAVLGLAGVGGFGALTSAAVRSGDQFQKLSLRLGASTEALSQLQFVAERSGVNFQTLTTGLQRLTRRASEAAAGTGPAVKVFQALGINAAVFAKLAPETQFEVIADRLNQVEDSSRKVALAQKLLDSEGVALIQTFQGGAEGIREQPTWLRV